MRDADNKLLGMKYGRLTILEILYKNKKQWCKCKCDCGNEKEIRKSDILNGKTKSCGCLSRETVTKHGGCKTRLYRILLLMKSRCNNKNHFLYKYYGGRGISICDEWNDPENGFINFQKWSLENGYMDNLTIDRINNMDIYKPDNCRWATKKEQSLNTRKNKCLEFDGQKLTKSQWCEKLGIDGKTLAVRIKNYSGTDFEYKIFESNQRIKQEMQSNISGITYFKESNKWVVQRIINGIRYYLGMFSNLDDAKCALNIFLQGRNL